MKFTVFRFSCRDPTCGKSGFFNFHHLHVIPILLSHLQSKSDVFRGSYVHFSLFGAPVPGLSVFGHQSGRRSRNFELLRKVVCFLGKTYAPVSFRIFSERYDNYLLSKSRLQFARTQISAVPALSCYRITSTWFDRFQKTFFYSKGI